MKKSLLLLSLLLLSPLFSEESIQDYPIQRFFEGNDLNVFFKNETGEMLKKIIVDGQDYYMQQDGDLFDEDVANIESEIFSARNNKYSFGKSKRLLATKIYPTHQKAFYSNCKYIVKEKKLIPLHQTCGFTYRKNKARSERIEWEHVVPAWHFGHQLQCWQNGGRMKCRESNTKFRQMEADMHNLVPAIGEINGDRSNFKYGMIEEKQRFYGKVKMKIDFSNRKAQPRPEVYGDIARTYFYMRDRYGLRISKSQEKMLIAWNNLDPVDRWEKKRNKMIHQLQGDENLYVSHYKKITQLNKQEETTNTFQDVQEELAQKYEEILEEFSKPIGSILLFVMTLFSLWYKNRDKRKKEERRREKQEKEKEKKIIENESFMLLSKLGDLALSSNDKDEIIIEKSDKTNLKQQWIFSKANQQKEFFFIENISTGKVIEVAHRDSNDGAKIILNKKRRSKNDHQEWSIEHSKEQGYIFIVNREVLNVLDVKDKKVKEGTKVQSFHKKIRGTENQLWKVIKI